MTAALLRWTARHPIEVFLFAVYGGWVLYLAGVVIAIRLGQG